jgi:hypothetical protein
MKFICRFLTVVLFLACSVGFAQSITNFSSRVFVTPAEPLVIGFNLSTEYKWEKKTVLIRAVGPGLKEFNVSNTAAGLIISRLDKVTNNVTWNSKWEFGANVGPDKGLPTMRDLESRVGAFPLNQGSTDAAMVLELPAGVHTVTISATTAGIALIEIYEIPNGQKG